MAYIEITVGDVGRVDDVVVFLNVLESLGVDASGGHPLRLDPVRGVLSASVAASEVSVSAVEADG